MKKTNRTIILAVVFALVMLVALTACNKDEVTFSSLVGQMNESANSTTYVKSVMSVTDSDVVVYKYEREITVNGNSASVGATEYTLSSTNFELDGVSSYDNIANFEKSTLIPISLDESKVSYRIDGDKMTVVVAKQNFASTMKVASFEPQGDVNVVLSFANGKIASINCSFTTTSGRNVTMQYTYSY